MSKIAFLLLTYDEHYKHKELEKFFKQGNIYVHAKYPDKVQSYLKNYIIKEYIETKWGDISLVKAEIKLLENAFKNKNNKWFILVSSSCCPLVNYSTLNKELNKNNLSFFNFYMKEKDGYYKTSQFWILNRPDAEIIINTQNKYLNLYKNFKIMDEKYFLTVLMNENNNYKFNNIITTYSRWINETNIYHPFVFNRLTPYDIHFFKENKFLFFRKISPTFSFKPLIPQKNLIILYIDKLKNNNNKKLNEISNNKNNNFDLIILYTTYGHDLLSQKIIDKAIYLLNVYHTNFDNTYKMFFKYYKDLLSQWKNIKLIKFE